MDISQIFLQNIVVIWNVLQWDNGPGTFNLVTKILVIEFSPEMCFSEFLLFFINIG